MSEHEHILAAYEFDENGGGKKLTSSEIQSSINSLKPAWVHLDANHSDTKKWLEKEFPEMQPLVLQALLEDETRPRITEIDDGILLILRGANLNDNSQPEDMVSIRLWVDKRGIISLRKRKLRAIGDIEDSIKAGLGPKSTSEFICLLIDRLFKRMEPVLASLDERTDNIEENIIENPKTQHREEIIDIRRKAIIFRRYMAPQRDAITNLRIADLSWMDELAIKRLSESINHVTRFIEDLDAIRERAQIVKDELSNILADRLNRNMYLLSVIAAIFLPLGFLTGLLGVNIGGIPGVNNSYAFGFFCGILFVIVMIQIYIFKKNKWF
jgi:zinc transporter